MAWAKLDDAMPHHPKVMMAGPQAFALDVAAICYSNRFGCDGFIADEMLPAVLPSLTSPRKWAAKLVQVGRWVREDGGWRVHDILDYQPTAEEQEAERAAARERMRKLRAKRKGTSRTRSDDVRPNTSGTDGEQGAHVPDTFVTPSRPPVPNGTGEEEGARAPDPMALLDATIPRRHLDALTFPGRPRLETALATAVQAGWPPGRAVQAVLAGSLDTAKSVGAVLVARAETLARQKPPPAPPDQNCPDCNGAGLRWSDDGTTAWPCGHPDARNTA